MSACEDPIAFWTVLMVMFLLGFLACSLWRRLLDENKA